jgi:nickel/cobalt transporter (NicO) family protein
MWQIFIGSLTLSLVHVSIPNHWIPIIAIGKSENWTQRRLTLATLITGFSHTLSTVIIGIIVGFIGYKLSRNYTFISGIVAPSLLAILGGFYILMDIKTNQHHDEHRHLYVNSVNNRKKSWFAIIFSLSLAMFLTPCVELEAYYFQASTIGWSGIFIVSAVYTFTTVLLMLLFVKLGSKGIGKINSHFLEHHEKGLTGILLMILGCIAYFVN